MGNLGSDLRLSLRLLFKTPSFTIFAVLALALGIGANTAIFSLIDAVLLRPLQFHDPERLVEVYEDVSVLGFPRNTPAPANAQDWKERNHVFEDMAADNTGILNITGGSAPPEEVENAEITANLLPLLGVQPLLGRNIRTEEIHENPAKVVLISYGVWQRRFGGRPDIIGKTIELDREAHEIIGVMPRGFVFPEAIDLWRPSRFRLDGAAALPRDSHFLHVYARLKPGVTVETAQREMQGIAAQLAREHPESNKSVGAVVVSLRERYVGDLKLGLMVLLGGVSALLLIACANVAGLLLARASGRRRELAVRAALGATRIDLVRQSVLESLILALAGGTLGILLAVWTLPGLQKLVPAAMAGFASPHVDWRVLVFTFGISAASALAFGSLPALMQSRIDLNQELQRGGRAGLMGNHRARRFLVTTEVALATTLLAGAMLLTQTLFHLANVPLGFHPEHILTARTSLPLSAESPYKDFETRTAFYTHVLERLRTIPGVRSAGYTTFLPLTNRGGSMGFEVEGRPAPKAGDFNDANARIVTPEYLQTMGDRLIKGRYFDASDRPDSLPVAIVNQAMARKYWPGEDALGKRIRSHQPNHPWVQIVGIVEDVRQMGLELEGRAEMYFPYTLEALSIGYFTPRDIAVRVSGEPLQYARALRAAVWSVDTSQPVIAIQPMQTLVDTELASREIQVKLICAFAVIALLLAALGLYGLLAFTVMQRVREIGVRMALGARQTRVLGEVMADGMRLVVGGVGVGAGGAWVLARGVQSILYGVTAGDARTFLATTGVLIAAGALACFLPARTAARVDPMEALRYE